LSIVLFKLDLCSYDTLALGLNRLECLSPAHFMLNWYLWLLENVRLGWKVLPRANTQAYLSGASVSDGEKSFMCWRQNDGQPNPVGSFVESTIIVQYDPLVQEVWDQVSNKLERFTWQLLLDWSVRTIFTFQFLRNIQFGQKARAFFTDKPF
jgi:hypothetical protein